MRATEHDDTIAWFAGKKFNEIACQNLKGAGVFINSVDDHPNRILSSAAGQHIPKLRFQGFWLQREFPQELNVILDQRILQHLPQKAPNQALRTLTPAINT
jgi:hypothetical protein